MKWRPVWKQVPGSRPRRWTRVGWQRVEVPYYSRSAWGADSSDELELQPGAWRGKVTLVVHHTVTKRAALMVPAAGVHAVRIVQGVHSGNRGGIGYQYLASGGALFEGRGFEVVAAAAFDKASGQGWNRGRYVHVAVPGDYSRTPIAEGDLLAIDSLIRRLRKKGVKVAGVVGHGDLMPTACPGKGGRASLAKHFGKLWKGAR